MRQALEDVLAVALGVLLGTLIIAFTKAMRWVWNRFRNRP